MKAGSVRQSKARRKAEARNSTPESEKPGIAAASVAGDDETGFEVTRRVKLPGPVASVTSVSWRSAGWLGWRAIAAVLGGLVLRLWMDSAFPQTGGDSLVYGNLGKTLLRHGQFALTDGKGLVHSTLIRLPGYPLFLAACFQLFGVENYKAVIWLQILLELGACLLLADFVRRIANPRAGLNTLWLAAMCPFTAVYASAPITESLTFDVICLALWSLERILSGRASRSVPNNEKPIPYRWPILLVFTLAISYAALLRPDGALLAVALWPALLLSRPAGVGFSSTLRKALLCALISILPFVIWTGRNWHTFHLFEPLAPRYATDPGEDPHLGWQHWVKTWCIDFTSTSEIYWNVPDGDIAADDLPERAYDSLKQREQTTELISEYSRDDQVYPDLDARFEALARERTAAHPIRTRVLLPLGRLADMLLRPRVENLPIELRWWNYIDHRPETRFCVVYAFVNLLFLLLGLAGFCYRPRLWPYMAAYLIMRSLLLATVEAPETRYTLEFFPIFFALGGITLQKIFSQKSRNGLTPPESIVSD